MSDASSLSRASLTSIRSGLSKDFALFSVPFRRFPLVCCSFRRALLEVEIKYVGFLSPSIASASSYLDCLIWQ